MYKSLKTNKIRFYTEGVSFCRSGGISFFDNVVEV